MASSIREKESPVAATSPLPLSMGSTVMRRMSARMESIVNVSMMHQSRLRKLGPMSTTSCVQPDRKTGRHFSESSMALWSMHAFCEQSARTRLVRELGLVRVRAVNVALVTLSASKAPASGSSGAERVGREAVRTARRLFWGEVCFRTRLFWEKAVLGRRLFRESACRESACGAHVEPDDGLAAVFGLERLRPRRERPVAPAVIVGPRVRDEGVDLAEGRGVRVVGKHIALERGGAWGAL